MALFNRLGSILKRSSVAGTQVPVASMLNSIRCMSSQKLFVGGLPWSANDEVLREAFASFGEVTEARVILDRDSGRSKGFGFVSFADTDAATSALAMDGQALQGRNIRVSYAQERSSGPRGGSGRPGGFRESLQLDNISRYAPCSLELL
ncbi:hypothetical protein M9H77_31220 [Catharanthus roseus]|uniref:Uncharacterized protein n=1 Tax=Catharanthus roseus TaxID=4058 RepID=A0ACC0A1T5_CATRO|nr:hypothetical protein M9H77_31220 [Catharanthus roseus]